MTLHEEIAQSLAIAAKQGGIRRAYISGLLNRYEDGYTVAKWTKVTLCGDVFWTNGKKHITSAQLLETLGTKLVKSGALTEAEFYG